MSNESFPVPQADRLDKVELCVHAVHAGADTTTRIADALGVVARQGAYYLAAAAYLELVQPVPSASGTWRLTDQGRSYVEYEPAAGAAFLAALVAEVPAVQLHLAGGGLKPVLDAYSDAGLDITTATRRAQTAAAWAAYLDVDVLADDAAAFAEARAAVVANAAAGLQRRLLQAAADEPAVCGRCFTQMPLTGICDC